MTFMVVIVLDFNERLVSGGNQNLISGMPVFGALDSSHPCQRVGVFCLFGLSFMAPEHLQV